MKIIYNNIIPFKGFIALNLMGYCFVREEYRNMPKDKFDKMYNHESIHTHQIKELLYIGFYILYLLEFLIRLPLNFFSPTRSYFSISFEREAYEYENNPEYLKNRKPYTWLKWIFKRSTKEKKWFP